MCSVSATAIGTGEVVGSALDGLARYMLLVRSRLGSDFGGGPKASTDEMDVFWFEGGSSWQVRSRKGGSGREGGKQPYMERRPAVKASSGAARSKKVKSLTGVATCFGQRSLIRNTRHVLGTAPSGRVPLQAMSAALVHVQTVRQLPRPK